MTDKYEFTVKNTWALTLLGRRVFVKEELTLEQVLDIALSAWAENTARAHNLGAYQYEYAPVAPPTSKEEG